jgi:hypothetical protein
MRLTALPAHGHVLSIFSHVYQLHVAELAGMADTAQTVCEFAKVDAFVEMANKNKLAITAASGHLGPLAKTRRFR